VNIYIIYIVVDNPMRCCEISKHNNLKKIELIDVLMCTVGGSYILSWHIMQKKTNKTGLF
jgi:hypothetical protein